VSSSVFYIDLPSVERYGRPNPPRTDSTTVNVRQYIGSEENRLVEVAVKRFLEASPNCNPLVFYGRTGTGKTLLARGLAGSWKHAHPDANVLCLTAADFARQYAAAVETDALDDFRRKYRDAAVLVLDDVHLISGKTPAQQELVHTLDSLLRHGRHALLTLQQSPAETPSLVPALASRLCGGLLVPLLPPGARAKRVILERLIATLAVPLPESVTRLLFAGWPDAAMPLATVPQLQGAVLQLANLTAKEDQPVNEEVLRQCLIPQDVLCGPQLRMITQQVCLYFKLKAADLKGPTRQQRVVRARGVAMLLARQLTNKSLEQVGRHFGNRDHTTVMHACRKTECLLCSDPAIRQAVNELTAQLSIH
jgi:chromosomal replication initiator protein